MSEDGPQPSETAEEKEIRLLTATLQIELDQWNNAGLQTGQVGFDMLTQVCRIDAVIKVLKRTVPEHDINVEFYKAMIERMTQIRTEFQAKVREEQMRQQIVIPPMFGPRGEKLN